MSHAKDICLKIVCSGVIHEIETFHNEYRNLMMLIFDKIYPDGFGECKGTGRCGTCHIEILGGDQSLRQRQGNENATLDKMEVISLNARLACQIPVDSRLNGIAVKVMVNFF